MSSIKKDKVKGEIKKLKMDRFVPDKESGQKN